MISGSKCCKLDVIMINWSYLKITSSEIHWVKKANIDRPAENKGNRATTKKREDETLLLSCVDSIRAI